ncbi:hypothetical protein [Streptosporangium sp. NBC_01756]|uniref:hypothetical protein n=1 Tax=Streptosporangium sp. NBC_01756 TaxID=2975950 RepID=UPI002DDA15E3|nr:hypothetical protein [Streptosporangium sp. NBC_01756]WSC89162.1 hypothetical protein OIE48_13530 [Streptosporangium sp. NBC_01756]
MSSEIIHISSITGVHHEQIAVDPLAVDHPGHVSPAVNRQRPPRLNPQHLAPKAQPRAYQGIGVEQVQLAVVVHRGLRVEHKASDHTAKPWGFDRARGQRAETISGIVVMATRFLPGTVGDGFPSLHGCVDHSGAQYRAETRSRQPNSPFFTLPAKVCHWSCSEPDRRLAAYIPTGPPYSIGRCRPRGGNRERRFSFRRMAELLSRILATVSRAKLRFALEWLNLFS